MEFVLFFVILVATTSFVNSYVNEKKNFLFIIVDDLRPVLGCYADAKAHTPNIDQLAQQSVIFDKAYAQQALCAPSRNSLLTSRRPDTLELYDFYSYWRHDTGNYTTLPQHLKNNGYTTVSLGKIFHPGASSNFNDDSPYSWSIKPFHPYTNRYKDAPVCSKNNSSPAKNLICPVRVSSMPNATLPDIETLKAAKRFLKDYRRDKPFFLAVGFQKPHIPFKYPKRYLKFHSFEKFSLPINYEWPKKVSNVAYNTWMDIRRRSDVEKLELECPWQKIPKKFGKKIIQSYYAAVSYVDDLIGKLLSELDTLRIRKNTIVVLTSDHGWSLGEHAEWAKYSNFEVSLRVPLIVSIPNVTYQSNDNLKLPDDGKTLSRCNNQIKKNYQKNDKIIDDIVELLDIFPTIAELAGVPIPKCSPQKINATMTDLCTEGSSLVPLIETSLKCKPKSWNKFAISQYPRPGIEPTCNPNSDEPRLKDITIMGYSLRTIQYRYTVWVNFSNVSKTPNWQKILAEELYDHKNDFEENWNIAGLKSSFQIKNNLKNLLITTVQKQ